MSFNIFASGSKKFHYQKDDCLDSSSFEPMKLVSSLMTMAPTALGATGAVISYKSPGIADLMGSLATIEFLHNLNNVLSFLSMCTGAANGWIAVSLTETHLLWPDTRGFAKYNFLPGDNPGAEFMKLIGPGLKDTDMNNWGALAALSMVLAKYYNHIGDDATPMLNISLDR